jgi:Na+/H+ antiporter NhaC
MDIERELRETQQLTDTAKRGADEYERQSKVSDRSSISRVIIWTFSILLGAIVLYLGVSTILCLQFNVGDPNQCLGLKDAAVIMKDILGSVALPVVTLVLGYYFGVEKKD